MFRILCIHHQGVQSCAWLELLVVVHRHIVVCLVGVWQRNFEPVVCVYCTAGWPAGRTVHTHIHTHTHTPQVQNFNSEINQYLYDFLTWIDFDTLIVFAFLFSPPWRRPHERPKHVDDYYVTKLHSYTQVHLLAFFF